MTPVYADPHAEAVPKWHQLRYLTGCEHLYILPESRALRSNSKADRLYSPGGNYSALVIGVRHKENIFYYFQSIDRSNKTKNMIYLKT